MFLAGMLAGAITDRLQRLEWQIVRVAPDGSFFVSTPAGIFRVRVEQVED